MTSVATAGPPAAVADPPPRPRLLANAFALFLAWLLPRASLAVSVVIAARVLGTDAFGAWGTAAALAVILSLVATLGMQPLLVRDLAREPERTVALVRAADAVKLLAGALMIGLVVAVSALLGHGPAGTAAAALLAIAYAIGSFVETRAARVQAEERMGLWTEASALYGLVAGGLGIVLVVATRSFVWYCIAPIAGQLAALGWLRRRAPLPRGRMSPRGADVRRLLVEVLPFAAGFTALTLHTKVAVLLLERWRGAADAGVFVAGFKFIDIAQALILVVVAAAYPRLARSYGRPGTSWHAAARLTELLALLVVPFAAALWLARAPAVSLLFGAGYADAVPVVALLAAGLPALAIDVAGAWVLGAAGRMRLVAALYAAAVLLDLALCALWIPSHGAVGAARAMITVEWTLALAMFAALHVTARVPPRAAVPLACAAVGAVAALAALVPDPTGGVLRALGPIAAATAIYAWTRAVPAPERALLVSLVRSRLRRAAE